MVLLEKPGIIPKLESPCNGPYEILEVYNNGTVQIKINSTVKEQVNLPDTSLLSSNVWKQVQ